MTVAWLWLWRRGRGRGARRRDPGRRRRGRLRAVGAEPRLPGLQHRRAVGLAPVGAQPDRHPGSLFGWLALPLLAVAGVTALRRGRMPEGVPLLALIVVVAAGLAFFGSQLEPAWAARYFAVLFGPLLLRARRGAGARSWLDAAGAGGGVGGPGAGVGAGRRARATCGRSPRKVGPELRPGDLVVCTQPEQIPVLVSLPAARAAVSDAARARRAAAGGGLVDGVARLRAGRAARVLGRGSGTSRPGAACCWSCRSTAPSRRRRGTARCGLARANGAPGCAATRGCARWASRRARHGPSAGAASGPSCSRLPA